MEQQHKRSAFSGKIGFVLSAAGASVGLGNIWRFPYLAAKYGGGIFLLVYILLAVTFGYTMIVAETALGRMTHKSPVSAYAHFGKGKGIRSSAAGSSTIWPSICAAAAVIWRQTATSPPLSPTACRPNWPFCCSACSRWALSLPVCATAWSASPR